MERIVLAYSGSLETTAAIAWLKETQQAAIIAVTLDLGQGRELEAVRDRALAAGALRAHVLDVRDEFARDYLLPALKAAAIGDGRIDPMATALSRPLIASKVVEIAAIEEAPVVAYGGANGTHDQGRLETAIRTLSGSLGILVPGREWAMTRDQLIEYTAARGVSVAAGTYRADANLWGRSIQNGMPEDTWNEPPEEIYTLTRSPLECPDEPADVEISFEHGVPTAINGVSMPAVELIGSIATIAGAHGVGRIEIIGGRNGGRNAREIVEAPAAVVLQRAHADLQKFVVGGDLGRFARTVGARYAEIVDAGSWFGPMRHALDGFVERVQTRVAGDVRLKLFKGDCRVVGRKSFVVEDPHPASVDVRGLASDARRSPTAAGKSKKSQ